MTIKEFGVENEKTLLLLPGGFSTMETVFGGVIPLLAKNFHVIGVDYDGFDGKGGEFTSFLRMAKKIEELVKKQFEGELYAAYGASMGGELVGLLVQRKNILIAHAVLGSSDLETCGEKTAKIKTRILSTALWSKFSTGEIPNWVRRTMNKKMGDEMGEQYLGLIEQLPDILSGVSRVSLERQYYSHLVTPLDTNIDVPGTRVHIFYAAKMGEKYLERYEMHFNNPDIVRRDYSREEMLFFHPEEWVDTLETCLA